MLVRATPNSSTMRLPDAFIWVCGNSRRELQPRSRAVIPAANLIRVAVRTDWRHETVELQSGRRDVGTG